MLVATEEEETLIKSFRNLPRTLVTVPSELEVATVIWGKSLLITEAALPLVAGEGDMSLHPNEVLLAPVVSEKSYSLISDRKYTFKVHKDAHKTQVRQAVEELFEVHVENVNILKVQAKPKRRGASNGKRPGWKKAIVQVREGETIEIFEGAQV